MKILVGLSGGVDSSVAACLLKEAGHEVVGATMSIWNKNYHYNITAHKDACFSPHEEQDTQEARALCETLGIPYRVIDCTEEYRRLVLENFKREYLSGRTPNPCVMCNASIKFKALPEKAAKDGIEFDKFATGHYARLSFDGRTQRFRLQRAVDERKDQSYFLYRLQQERLAGIMLPLGNFTKDQVRETARKYGLKVSDKPDSQDFYSGDINDILQTEPQTGNFVDADGRILGRHKGIWNYTTGQRKGLGISAERPLYVMEIRPETNEVVLGFDEERYRESLTAGNVNWVSVSDLERPVRAFCKVRSTQKPVPAEIVPRAGGSVEVVFQERQKASATGQSVVFYDEEGFVLGGGIIERNGQ